MTKYRKYIRELTASELKNINVRHKFHLENKGFLTKRQKKRLLKLGKKEKGSLDSEFWYRLKHSARNSLFDLELIAKVADELQLQEIFEPLTKEDYARMDKGKYLRTDLKYLIESLFSSHKPELSHRDDWRYRIAEDMVTIGLGYFKNLPAFQSNLHTRLFQDVEDSIRGYSDSTFSTLNH